MKHFILILISLYFISANAAFNRFWIGYKKGDRNSYSFISALNQNFFGKTIEMGGGKGLLAYQPYITKMSPLVPDEIALVTYKNEAIYRALRATPAGQAYAALHWDYFQKVTSKSTSPVPFQGTLSIGNAYELNPDFENWQKGRTYLIIYQLKWGQSLREIAQAYSRLRYNPKINNSAILVLENLVIEYRSYKSREPNPQYLPMTILEGAILHNLYLGQGTIGRSEGINFQF